MTTWKQPITLANNKAVIGATSDAAILESPQRRFEAPQQPFE